MATVNTMSSKLLSQFWRAEVLNQRVVRALSPLKIRAECFWSLTASDCILLPSICLRHHRVSLYFLCLLLPLIKKKKHLLLDLALIHNNPRKSHPESLPVKSHSWAPKDHRDTLSGVILERAKQGNE